MDEEYLKLVEARALRNAARNLVQSDVQLIREGVGERGLAERAFGRVYDSVADAAEGAREITGSPLRIAAVVGAVGVLWFARRPILRAFDTMVSAVREQAEPTEHYENDTELSAERPGHDPD